jgi:hypothetical protein
MLLNAGSIDRLADLEINVPIEDFLNAGVFTARPEKARSSILQCRSALA